MKAMRAALAALIVALAALAPSVHAAEVVLFDWKASATVTNGTSGEPNPSKLDVRLRGALDRDTDGNGSHETRHANADLNLRRVQIGGKSEQETTARFYDADGRPLAPTVQRPEDFGNIRRVEGEVLVSTDENPKNGWDHTVFVRTPRIPTEHLPPQLDIR